MAGPKPWHRLFQFNPIAVSQTKSSISRHSALAFTPCIRFSQRYKLPYHSRRTFSLVCRWHTNLECAQSKLVGEASPCFTCLQLLYRHLATSSMPDRAVTGASPSIDEEIAPCFSKLKTTLLSPAFSQRYPPSLSCRRESLKPTCSHSTGSQLGRPQPDIRANC